MIGDMSSPSKRLDGAIYRETESFCTMIYSGNEESCERSGLNIRKSSNASVVRR